MNWFHDVCLSVYDKLVTALNPNHLLLNKYDRRLTPIGLGVKRLNVKVKVIWILTFKSNNLYLEYSK